MKTVAQKEKQKHLKEIAKIQNMKPPEQWKAAKDFALKVNPALKKENDVFMKEIETLREQQTNDDASSAGGSLRFSLSMPVTILNTIRAFDPDFMMYDKADKTKYKTKRSTNREVRLLMKTFPEYKIPRRG